MDVSGPVPTVLRLGGIGVVTLSGVLGDKVEVRTGFGGPGRSATPAPGTLPSHYAPAARVEMMDADDVSGRARVLLDEGLRVGLLAPRRLLGLPDGLEALPPAGGAPAYAAALYQRLREADRRGLDVLLAVPPPSVGIGAAVADRLRRAAATVGPTAPVGPAAARG